MHTPDVDDLGQRRVHLAQLKDLALRWGEMARGRGNLVVDHQGRLVHRIVLGLIAQTMVWLDHQTEVNKFTERHHLGPGTGHVEIDLNIVSAGVVPVDARYFGDAHTGQTVRAPLAHRGDGATAHARIGDPRTLNLAARLNDITHGPDAHRFPRSGDLQVRRGDARVVLHRLQDGPFVYLQVPILIARLRPKGDLL